MANLFLSRIVLPLDEALQNGYRTTYDWHRFVWLAFPNKENLSRDFLYRVDFKDRQVVLLVQSSNKPSSIGKRAFETKEIMTGFYEHDAYRFQVRVNPTFRRSSDGRRLPIYKEDDLRCWFERKFSSVGCELKSLETDHPHDDIFHKDGKRGKHVSVDARGVIIVADKKTFYEKIVQGIGSAKGFGYGLVMLQPITF